MGPGVVFILGAVGAQDFVTGSIAGATYGYSLLWLLLASLVARFVIVDATARYVVVTGESLMAGFGRISKWIVLLWFVVVVLTRHVSSLMKIVLLGAAGHLALPLPTTHSVAIWGLFSWVAGFALMCWGRYRLVEKLSKPLAVVMGSCLAAAAILSRPDSGDLVRGALTPVLPMEQGLYSPALVFMGVMSTAGSFSNVRYPAYVHEKGWRNLSFLRRQRMDLLLSMCGMFCMLGMIQVAAAGALKPRGIEVGELEDLIPIFAAILGHGGHVILGVTLWSIVFSSYLGTGTGYGIMISDVYYRFVRRSAVIAEQNQAAGEMSAYRWVVLYVFVSPLYVFFTDWTPIGLVLFKAAASVVLLPIVTLAVLRLTADKKIMGAHANGWFTNVVLVLTTVAAVYLGYQGAAELLRPGG